ncbi:MAG: hypothetical protein R3C97_17265 [Geminicoccaceae bacterium]
MSAAKGAQHAATPCRLAGPFFSGDRNRPEIHTREQFDGCEMDSSPITREDGADRWDAARKDVFGDHAT